jgi:cyanophycinase
MDALVAAGVAAGVAAAGHDPTVRVVVVPTAVARHRPELAVAHAERAFRAAADRAGVEAEVIAVMALDRPDAEDRRHVTVLEAAQVIHLPGGDPDVIPTVLRDTRAWAAILRAVERGACLAGASAGAMALAARLWTQGGPMDGLGLVPGIAVLPHYAPGRLAGWRATADADGRLTWLGLDEQTMVIGRPGETWRVEGRGRAHLIPPGTDRPSATAGAGETLDLTG